LTRDRARTGRFIRPQPEVERALQLALGPVDLPPGTWDRLEARLALETVHPETGRAHGEGGPAPALAAVASFCVLFQAFLAAGGFSATWVKMQHVVHKLTFLVLSWADVLSGQWVGR